MIRTLTVSLLCQGRCIGNIPDIPNQNFPGLCLLCALQTMSASSPVVLQPQRRGLPACFPGTYK